MVHITSETVEKFKQMFKKEYGVDYSDQEAWGATHNLIGAFDILLQMDRKQHPENYKKKQNSEKQGGGKIKLWMKKQTLRINQTKKSNN